MTTPAPGSEPAPTPAPAAAPAAPAASAPVAPTPTSRRRSIFGLISVITLVVAILPVGIILLIAMIPDMWAILWLLIVVIPVTIGLAIIALILGILGLIPPLNRGRSVVLPIIGTVLSAVVVVGAFGLLDGWYLPS